MLISNQDNFSRIENSVKSFNFVCLSSLINDDSIEIIHLYQLSLGSFACCDNDLHLIENLLYNLIFNIHEMLELFFC
jgi:hypothetical protein